MNPRGVLNLTARGREIVLSIEASAGQEMDPKVLGEMLSILVSHYYGKL